jgi:ribosome-binding protein aMBF1 (putative translation factor)
VIKEMVMVSCKICGKQINRKPSALKNKSGFSFCSLSCAGKYSSTVTPKRKDSPKKTLKQKVLDRAYWVSKGDRPLNPIAREAWDRRVQAGEIHEYPLPLNGQTA